MTDPWEYYAGIPAPTYDPFKATRETLRRSTFRRYPYPILAGSKRMSPARKAALLDSLIHGPRWASSITWACPKPTDPAYPIGSRGYIMTRSEARLMDAMADSNRKLNAQWNAKVSAIQELLGVTPHGTDDSQVP